MNFAFVQQITIIHYMPTCLSLSTKNSHRNVRLYAKPYKMKPLQVVHFLVDAEISLGR